MTRPAIWKKFSICLPFKFLNLEKKTSLLLLCLSILRKVLHTSHVPQFLWNEITSCVISFPLLIWRLWVGRFISVVIFLFRLFFCSTTTVIYFSKKEKQHYFDLFVESFFEWMMMIVEFCVYEWLRLIYMMNWWRRWEGITYCRIFIKIQSCLKLKVYRAEFCGWSNIWIPQFIPH